MYEPTIIICQRLIGIILLLPSQPPQEMIELRPRHRQMSTADFILHNLAEEFPLWACGYAHLLQQIGINLRPDLPGESANPLPESAGTVPTALR